MNTTPEIKSEIQRQIKLVMSDPRFFGNYDQAEQIVLENAGFVKVEKDPNAMRVRN